MYSEVLMRSSKGSKSTVLQDIHVDCLSPISDDQENCLSGAAERELQTGLVFEENKESLIINEPREDDELSYSRRLQSRKGTADTSYIQPYTGGMDIEVGNRKAESESSLQTARIKKPSPRSVGTSLLSNRERLLMRKQALRIKKQPMFAIGKSNVITGVAKVIKAHFEKHPLAIVNVKGRAKGTSVQEVIYNLEQATGAVLVSQEPSKVILYRGWGLETEPEEVSKKVTKNLTNSSINQETNARPLISPELLSAIRLECGLTSPEERLASGAANQST